jgi:hypothetical protein
MALDLKSRRKHSGRHTAHCCCCCCAQVLNEVKDRLSSLVSSSQRLRQEVAVRQKDIGGVEAQFSTVANQSQHATTTLKVLQAQHRDV